MIYMDEAYILPIGTPVVFTGIGKGVICGHSKILGKLYVWVRWTSFRAPDHLCAVREVTPLGYVG